MKPSALPERKRKRPQPDQPHLPQLNSGDSSDGKTTAAIAESDPPKPSPAPPGDEEVEEFFAILRRMHAAVKHYGKSAHGDANERWTAALGAGLPLPAKKAEPKASTGQAKNCVNFDLNTVPAEAAEAEGG